MQRREFLKAAAALGIGAVLPSSAAATSVILRSSHVDKYGLAYLTYGEPMTNHEVVDMFNYTIDVTQPLQKRIDDLGNITYKAGKPVCSFTADELHIDTKKSGVTYVALSDVTRATPVGIYIPALGGGSVYLRQVLMVSVELVTAERGHGLHLTKPRFIFDACRVGGQKVELNREGSTITVNNLTRQPPNLIVKS